MFKYGLNGYWIGFNFIFSRFVVINHYFKRLTLHDTSCDTKYFWLFRKSILLYVGGYSLFTIELNSPTRIFCFIYQQSHTNLYIKRDSFLRKFKRPLLFKPTQICSHFHWKYLLKAGNARNAGKLQLFPMLLCNFLLHVWLSIGA